jgi:non-ribosomal peptide synthetase component F/aryl carrier-like protein
VGSAAVDPALAAIWAEVLGVDALDVDDDFFALGGNSLLATQIAARVADALGIEMPLEAVFEAPTLGAYAELVRAAGPAAAPSPADGGNGRGGALRWLRRGGRGDGERHDAAGAAVPEGALSALQESAWSVQHYVPDTRPHVGQVFAIQGPLDVAALERALTALVERHAILRTTFPRERHRPRARVQPPGPIAIEQIAPRRARDEEVRRLVDDAWAEPFDPAVAPPLRVRLIRTGKQSHVLVFIAHEIVCDGQAYDLLVRELGQLYDAALAGAPSPLPEPAPQYADLVRSHGTRLAGADARAGSAYWRAALDGAPLTLPLPFDDGTATPGRSGYARRSVQLPAQLAARLRALAQEEAATSFMLHLAALCALLHRWTGETDLLVKSPAANRARLEWEQAVGFFSMVLPLRVDAGGDPSFRTLLRRARACALAGFRHAATAPEDNALREVDGLRGLGGWAPLLRLWDPTTEQPLALGGARAKPYRDDGEGGRLVLVVTERADGRTVLQLSSTAEELGARGVGELLRHHERLLTLVAEDPDRRIGSELDLLTPAERELLRGRAGSGRGGTGEPAGDDGLHGLVAAQARRAPDAVAFDAGGGRAPRSYGELDARAERLAAALRTGGVAAGDRIGLLVAPSEPLLVAMLGALKAGAVCVPLLDPGFADDPLAGLPPLDGLVAADGAAVPAGAPPLLAKLDADGAVAGGGAPGGGAAGGGAPGGGAPDGGAADGEVAPERVALVLRTAGVTGPPRAVELTHRALCRAALRQRDAQRLTPADRVAHVPGRGAWSWALAPWAALAAGATVVGPERAPDPGSATPPTGWLEANDVTVAAMGAGPAGAALARAAALPAALRLLLVQGPGPLAVPAEAGGRSGLVVQRQYGLAEAGGVVLAERATGDVAAGAPVAGEPIGARAAVLDAHGNVAPPGVAGELCLEGLGATADEPLRTGDLALRRADGALAVHGRLDDEVRHRGVRLNPIMRDLEAALAAHPAVQDAAACWEPSAAALVACLVPRRTEAPARRELDAWLQRTMADWILPACFVAVEAIPRRADGLPDRRALAASPAVADAVAARGAAAAPQTRTERGLAAIWSKVLGERKPGLHDNFFTAGGNLIRGIELAGRAREAGIAIDPGDVMYRPSIAELAAIADEKG